MVNYVLPIESCMCFLLLPIYRPVSPNRTKPNFFPCISTIITQNVCPYRPLKLYGPGSHSVPELHTQLAPNPLRIMCTDYPFHSADSRYHDVAPQTHDSDSVARWRSGTLPYRRSTTNVCHMPLCCTCRHQPDLGRWSIRQIAEQFPAGARPQRESSDRTKPKMSRTRSPPLPLAQHTFRSLFA